MKQKKNLFLKEASGERKVDETNTRSTASSIFIMEQFKSKKRAAQKTLMKLMQDVRNTFLRNYKTYCLIEFFLDGSQKRFCCDVSRVRATKT